MEHGEEISGWHEHVVTKPTSNDRVVHNWLVGLVLEVAVPATSEVWGWPRLHLLELLLSRADLDTGFNTIGGKRASTLEVPFIKDAFLDLRLASDKVIKTLSA